MLDLTLNNCRMLSDMGQALDWVHGLAVQNKWKSVKIRFGPGMYIFIGAHPEAAQTILRSGMWYKQSLLRLTLLIIIYPYIAIVEVPL